MFNRIIKIEYTSEKNLSILHANQLELHQSIDWLMQHSEIYELLFHDDALLALNVRLSLCFLIEHDRHQRSCIERHLRSLHLVSDKLFYKVFCLHKLLKGYF